MGAVSFILKQKYWSVLEEVSVSQRWILHVTENSFIYHSKSVQFEWLCHYWYAGNVCQLALQGKNGVIVAYANFFGVECSPVPHIKLPQGNTECRLGKRCILSSSNTPTTYIQ